MTNVPNLPDDTGREALDKRRRQRNLVVGGVLLFFVVLFYAITIVRMGD
ncbi:hypothetical protein HME9302_01637 [Alteripontixanthobacter maritimus]|uniref:Cytochrome C oxidase assembly protein n=1 Tax=Alteripontixanthobacter maritimus TaxID=2161824 RepID=A0A369Q7S5_9SPHN|nr:hypothetical protein [Alteripontixanthobacter maritimus]RDC60430.1 hypothetical protein HME9302_01637 [Alteripontixanthobacter maritimus]